jgi:hypothetical protein
MKRNPIANYCEQQVEGWQKLPVFLNLVIAGNEEFSCSFLRQSDGVHLMASVKDLNALNTIHVSLAPIRSCRKDWTDEEHGGHIFDVAAEVIESFFPGRKFLRQPDDELRPQVKHYFSILEANE